MKFPAAVVAALCFLPAVASAQITTAGGVVVDSVTGQPISGALVSLTGNGFAQSVASRDDGSFRFTKVTPGTYTLAARRLGFAPLEMPIPIEENGVRIKVSLVRITALDTVRARPGTGIGGQVGTLKTLRPLANAEIAIVGVGVRAKTDSVGRFYVPLKAPGTYVVRARTAGYEPVALSVVVPRDSTARLMLLMDTATSARSNAHELAWVEFNERARMRGTRSAIISHGELAQTGEPGLLEALQIVPAISSKQLRFGQFVCIFVDGRPQAAAGLRTWDVDEVEAVEVYTRRTRAPRSPGHSRVPHAVTSASQPKCRTRSRRHATGSAGWSSGRSASSRSEAHHHFSRTRGNGHTGFCPTRPTHPDRRGRLARPEDLNRAVLRPEA